MDKNLLGKTGLSVSKLGFGSMGLRGPKTWGIRNVDDSTAERILNQVLDSGINFIDTAPDYGLCEERIGRFLHHRRDEFFIATKCGCDSVQHDDHLEIRHTWNKETVRRNIENSLRKLQTDHIDLVQFHGGDAVEIQRAGLIELLMEYRSQGILGSIGVSSSIPKLESFLVLGVFDVFQVPYSCLSPTHGPWIDRIASTGAGVVIRGATAQGGPEAEIQRPTNNAIWEQAKLSELIPPDMKPAELILRYTLSHPNCHTAIVGTCNFQHLAENVAAAKKGILPKDLYNAVTAAVGSAIAEDSQHDR